jgi:hypothetical protein
MLKAPTVGRPTVGLSGIFPYGKKDSRRALLAVTPELPSPQFFFSAWKIV